MSPESSFAALLGVVLINVICWAIVLLRVMQNIDTTAAKIVLFSQITIPIGYLAAFVYGWVRRERHLRTVMLVWSGGLMSMIVLLAIESLA